MTYWKQLDRKTIYHSDWLSVTLDKIELPDGTVIENFELMRYPHDAVGVIAIDNEGKILLVRAYRYLHESYDWEIPGGVVELNETHVEAVRRELMEETGYSADIITPKISYFPHKATCDQEYFIYLAEGLECECQEFQKTEITEIKFFTPDEVKAMIDEGKINDGMSLVALQRYFLKRGI
jgi:8-oxo-dGTP pyrophosphatase MutT (NUDIX family)